MYDPKDLDRESDTSEERRRKKERRKHIRDQARKLKQTHKELDPFSYYFGQGEQSPPKQITKSISPSYPRKGFLGDDMKSSKYGKDEMRTSRYQSKAHDSARKRRGSKSKINISPKINSRSPNRK